MSEIKQTQHEKAQDSPILSKADFVGSRRHFPKS